MDCVVEERGIVAVVSPRGDLDAASVGAFQERVDELLRGGTHNFVIDLGGVGFVDSAGLAALVRLYKHVRIGEGDVRLAAVPPTVMQIFDLTRLSRVFDIFPTAAEAAASIESPS
jgi:anti-sigma B factor antagonist